MSVIYPVGDDQTVRFAAGELQRYLDRLGRSMRVEAQDEHQPVERDGIRIGLANSFPDVHLPAVDDPALDDVIGIDVTDGRGVICGVNPRSVLLAVYRYLTELGFRWVRPGPDGEVTPPADDLGRTVRLTERPSYRHRAVCIEGAVSYDNVAAMIDWLPKVGMNGYFIQFLTPMTFFERWSSHRHNPTLAPEPLTPDDVRDYVGRLGQEIVRRGLLYHAVGHGWTCEPFGVEGLSWEPVDASLSDEVAQCLAEVDGKRELWKGVPLNTNLCYSTPRVREKMIDFIVDYLRRTPVDILHLWLADGKNNHCECAECRLLRPSDYYVRLLNELDERLTAEGSMAKVAFLIYCDLLWPPTTERFANPDRFILMFAPITRTYSVPFAPEGGERPGVPAYERNGIELPTSVDANLEFLRGWQQIFAGDSFDFDYHFMWDHYLDPGYYAMAQLLHEDIRNLKSLGLNGYVSCQTQRAFFPTGLGMTVMARTLWDADLEFDEIARDYFAASFGPDSKAARSYLASLSELFHPPYLRGEEPAVDPAAADRFGRIPGAIDDFSPTIAEHTSRSGPQGRSWRYLAHHAELCRRLAAALQARASGDAEASARAWEEAKRYAQSIETEVQPDLDVFLFIGTVRSRVIEKPVAAS
jgi:hypothetical protein